MTDMESVRLLVLIDELGSIGLAAKQLGMTQPAASARLRGLEARWRLSLVERSARGSSLTVDGKTVCGWARRVLREYDSMVVGLGALSGERRASLCVAASLTIAEFKLPGWIGELRRRDPSVHASLRVVNSDRVCGLVRDGTAHIGFIETQAIPQDLRTLEFDIDSLALVTAPVHPWAALDDGPPLAALQQTEYVMREPGSGTRRTFERALGAELKIALEVSSTAALIGAARAGIAPAVVSRLAVAEELENGVLVEVVHELDLRRPLTVVWDAERRFTEHVEDLIQIVVDPGRRRGRAGRAALTGAERA